MECKIDQSKYGVPMPWIGIYITAASVACSIAMLGDFIWGIRHRRLWFPCKLFSLNATSLTLIAIAAKLAVDLNNPMPAAREQLAKRSGTAFLCITMANFMTSLANMKGSDVILNVAPLGILVIAVVVNVCIQMGTGVIHAFLPEHTITMFFLLIVLMFTCNVALDLMYLKPLAKVQCMAIHESMSRDGDPNHDSATFGKDLNRYWTAVLCSDPQYLSYGLRQGIATDILSILETGVLIQALVRTLKKGSVLHDCTSEQASSSSDYRWSIGFILYSQVAAVVVGVLGPLYRILQIYHQNVEMNFKKFENINGDTQSTMTKSDENVTMKMGLVKWFEGLVIWFGDLVDLFKVEMELISEGIRTLLVCDFDPVRFHMIQSRSCRRLFHCSKNMIVGILVWLQLVGFAIAVLLSRLKWVLLLFSCLFSLKKARIMQQALFPFTKDSLVDELKKFFYTQTESDDTQTALRDFLKDVKRWRRGITNGVLLFRFVSAKERIRGEVRKHSPANLVGLLRRSDPLGQQDPLVHVLDVSSLDDCWALRLANLTSIAILMPCKDRSQNEERSAKNALLLNAVSEGLEYVRFLDKHSRAPINVRKAANMVWEDIELYCRWFTVDVSKFMGKRPMEVIQCLEQIVNSYSIFDSLMENVGKSPKALARKSMSAICRCIREQDRHGFSSASNDEAYERLYRIIGNLLAARLMDLRQALPEECHRNAIDGKEERVEEVASLLSKAEGTIEALEREGDGHHLVTAWKYYYRGETSTTHF